MDHNIAINKQGGYRLTIDVIKGVAIFLVLWGHCIQFSSAGYYDYFSDAVFKFIYSFHMPLFALISGYLFFDSLRKRSLMQSIKTRLSGLLWPIVLWCTVRFALDAIICILKGDLLFPLSVSAWWNEVTGMFLWFLWSILASSICITLAMKLLPEKLRIVGASTLLFAMYLFPNKEMNLFLYPYFLVGFLSRKIENKWKPYWKKIAFAATLVFAGLLFFYTEECYIYNSGVTLWSSKHGILSQFVIDVYRYTIGFAGSIAVIGVISLVALKLPKVKAVASWGQNSMQIYILQCFCLSQAWSIIWTNVVERLTYNPLTKNEVIFWCVTAVMAILLIFILSGVANILKMFPRINRILFGR